MAIEDDTNENANTEKYANGQLVVGDKGGADDYRGKNIQERIQCNDSVV